MYFIAQTYDLFFIGRSCKIINSHCFLFAICCCFHIKFGNAD